MTRILYEGKDISGDVEVADMVVTDGCGEQADAIDAVFSNSENQWSGWAPKKQDMLGIVFDGYRAGTMWIDRIRQERGLVSLGAVSIPPGGRTKRTRVWERVTLITIAAQIAALYGMTAKCIEPPTYVYERVDQIGRGDFGFLQERAALEGCSIKIQDNVLYLYADPYLEGLPAVKTIDASDFLEDPRFSDSSQNTYGMCSVAWQSFRGTFEDPDAVGPELLVGDYPVSSSGEAQRFAKNLLRGHNRKEFAGEISAALDSGVTAGNTVNITGTGMNDGKYFIDTAKLNFAEKIARYALHRCFTRY